MKLKLFFLLLMLTAVVTAQTPIALWLSLESKTRLEFDVDESISAVLKVENGSISLQFSNGQSQDLAVVEDGLFGEMRLEIRDFNFDARPDIAVSQAFGYGGVNVFSDVFSYRPESQRYEKLLHGSNVEVRKKQGELKTSQKSGPRFYSKHYRFADGQPYPYLETMTIGYDLEKITLKRPNGEVKRSLIALFGAEKDTLNPAILPVQAERAYLYNEPAEESKTKMYVIRDDKVTILDTGGPYDEWFKIRYQGKKVIEKWIRAETLEEGL